MLIFFKIVLIIIQDLLEYFFYILKCLKYFKMLSFLFWEAILKYQK